MSYTPPAGTAADFAWQPGTYTPPASDAVDFDFAPVTTAPVGAIDATLTITSAIAATATPPTFTAAMAATLGFEGEASALHGITGQAGAVLTIAPSFAAVHPRYQLIGTVIDTGTPVDRRVRAYSRSTGELAHQVDTVDGAFVIEAGFAIDEYYLVPIDLATDATDWTPPVANRVLSVLKVDA